ncbi:MAG: hypothetical protein ACOX9E_08385 [Lentisphaeria bacterium]|jgi:hypothetical protein
MPQRNQFRKIAAVLVMLAAAVMLRAQDSAAPALPTMPLTADELAAQRYLRSITIDLAKERENDTWRIGGSQHNNLSKRYQLAFSGYAAAALGMRTPAYPALTVAIMDDIIQRMLKKDVWVYVKDYWGDKPWFPDPCYDENIMYTGHLLQLLAFYELFSGDDKYRRDGFDFVWDDKTTIHYDVQKLIDVTVRQMRDNDSGGVSCEPDLIFFPCNNHPQIALFIHEQFGLGNWQAERRRWEQTALKSYANPLLGGGAIKLVYQRKYKLMLPRGHIGLDGWSLLWYQPWATNLDDARRLWRESVKCIQWDNFSNETEDVCRGKATCMDPANVPPTATASFMAAAARALGDDATATRFETFLDRYLRRDNDMFYLDLDREWRIGCSANRITALAIRNGSDFRTLLRTRQLPNRGPHIAELTPAGIAVAEAVFADGVLRIGLVGKGPATLRLAGISTPPKALTPAAASFADNTITIPHINGQCTITVAF